MINATWVMSAVCVAFSLCACGDDESPREQVTVLVVDDGIDPSLDVFSGKIAATHTVFCTTDESEANAGSDASTAQATPIAPVSDAGSIANDAGASDTAGQDDNASALAAAKADMLRSLELPDNHCELRPGIQAPASPFADIEPSREGWNRAVFSDKDIVDDPLLGILEQRARGGAFHGTSTAGIIAYENDKVRMVLVNRALSTIQEVMQSIACPTQTNLDLTAQLLRDPEIQQAYVARPRGADDVALAQMMIDQNVSLVNESFGPLSRYGLETILSELMCPEVDLRGYFAAMNELQRLDQERLPSSRALIIRAAGNEKAMINNISDSLDCRPANDPVRAGRILIGSYDVVGRKSRYTNFGDCVDVFAPGDAVLGPLPGAWWYPNFGTSFAAPLVTRLLVSMHANRQLGSDRFDIAAARAALLALRRPDGSIPRPRFPEPLLYLPGQPSPLALTTHQAPPKVPVALAKVAQKDLHALIWPLRWVQRRQRQ